MKLQLYFLLYLLPLIGAIPLNPQPLPPGFHRGDEVAERDASAEAIQPQPLPPGIDKREPEALNPQPLPPGFHHGDEVTERDASAIQPQPLPPGIRPVGGH